MSSQKLYFFVGYPGAGKTTVSKIIAAKTEAVHLWADEVRQSLFNKARLSEAETKRLYESLYSDTSRLLSQGRSVIFDTNFNFEKDRQSVRQLAEQHHADAVLIWLQTPLAVAQERATQLADGHHTRVWGNMPAEDFERISNNLQPPTAAEQPVIFDGSNFDETMVIERLGLE